MNELSIIIQITKSNWIIQNNKLLELVNGLSDEDLQKETAPNRNTGYYLLGHLIVVHDRMLPLLGLGERIFPELSKPFLELPENDSTKNQSSIAELKDKLVAVNKELNDKIEHIGLQEWFTKHTSVSVEDFKKDLSRNKLSILINRTNHLSYHLGQMAYLKSK
jgi:hypothetical protein